MFALIKKKKKKKVRMKNDNGIDKKMHTAKHA